MERIEIKNKSDFIYEVKKGDEVFDTCIEDISSKVVRDCKLIDGKVYPDNATTRVCKVITLVEIKE